MLLPKQLLGSNEVVDIMMSNFLSLPYRNIYRLLSNKSYLTLPYSILSLFNTDRREKPAAFMFARSQHNYGSYPSPQ